MSSVRLVELCLLFRFFLGPVHRRCVGPSWKGSFSFLFFYNFSCFYTGSPLHPSFWGNSHNVSVATQTVTTPLPFFFPVLLFFLIVFCSGCVPPLFLLDLSLQMFCTGPRSKSCGLHYKAAVRWTNICHALHRPHLSPTPLLPPCSPNPFEPLTHLTHPSRLPWPRVLGERDGGRENFSFDYKKTRYFCLLLIIIVITIDTDL